MIKECGSQRWRPGESSVYTACALHEKHMILTCSMDRGVSILTRYITLYLQVMSGDSHSPNCILSAAIPPSRCQMITVLEQAQAVKSVHGLTGLLQTDGRASCCDSGVLTGFLTLFRKKLSNKVSTATGDREAFLVLGPNVAPTNFRSIGSMSFGCTALMRFRSTGETYMHMTRGGKDNLT